ncbi:MAG: hypothetical protein R6U17_01820 [Thermoplasmata archaeon]
MEDDDIVDDEKSEDFLSEHGLILLLTIHLKIPMSHSGRKRSRSRYQRDRNTNFETADPK